MIEQIENLYCDNYILLKIILLKSIFKYHLMI